MKELLCLLCLFFAINCFAQVYKDNFNFYAFSSNATAPANNNYWGVSNPVGALTANFYSSETPISWGNFYAYRLNRSSSSAAYISISLKPYWNPSLYGSGALIKSLNMSGGNDTIFVIASTSKPGTKLRIDIKDTSGYISNSGSMINELPITTTKFSIYKFVYLMPKDSGNGAINSSCGSGPCNVNLNVVSEFEWYVNADSTNSTADVQISAFQVGGSVECIMPSLSLYSVLRLMNTNTVCLLPIQNAALEVSSGNLYPNPVSDVATIDLTLKTNANVKVTLTDLYGKEVNSNIFTGNTNHVSASVNTANLENGTYVINYFINDSPAKSNKLVVLR